MNQTTAAEISSDPSYVTIGIYVNLAINILLIIERIIKTFKKSECTAGASGVSVKVDNSKDQP